MARRVPGIQVRDGRIDMRGGAGFGTECSPAIYLVGMQLRGERLDDLVPLSSVDAIDVYRGPATVPPQWRGTGSCGVIAVWTRH